MADYVILQDEAEREWLVQQYEMSLQQDVSPQRQLHIAKSMHKAEVRTNNRDVNLET